MKSIKQIRREYSELRSIVDSDDVIESRLAYLVQSVIGRILGVSGGDRMRDEVVFNARILREELDA